jgi:hypothetical protein
MQKIFGSGGKINRFIFKALTFCEKVKVSLAFENSDLLKCSVEIYRKFPITMRPLIALKKSTL